MTTGFGAINCWRRCASGSDRISSAGSVLHHDDVSGFHFRDDIEFTRHLIADIGVAAVRARAFTTASWLSAGGFAFCKRAETWCGCRAAE